MNNRYRRPSVVVYDVTAISTVKYHVKTVNGSAYKVYFNCFMLLTLRPFDNTCWIN